MEALIIRRPEERPGCLTLLLRRPQGGRCLSLGTHPLRPDLLAGMSSSHRLLESEHLEDSVWGWRPSLDMVRPLSLLSCGTILSVSTGKTLHILGARVQNPGCISLFVSLAQHMAGAQIKSQANRELDSAHLHKTSYMLHATPYHIDLVCHIELS